MFKEYPVVDVSIVGTTQQNALDEVICRAEQGAGGYACFVNAHVAVMTRQREDVKVATQESTFSFPDGMPVYLTGKYLYGIDNEKISGPDFLGSIFSSEKGRRLRHYFYGSTQDVLDALLPRLKSQYPGCNIVGAISPPFRELTAEEKVADIKAINDAGAQIVWVGLGAPKQELWMQHNTNQIPGAMLMGVGAAFDFHAGIVTRAPKWVQTRGLEWLHRFMQEPGRLGSRYLETNSLFVLYTLHCQLLRLFGRKT